ncbi:hypothetical protein [Streptomyces xantholiticus]|uniref:Uncharacterized protein n=1 Tax=Streptomyces xantholiticus TaxID=68285 RepID=A0ABV1UZZ1_9ACTN
MTFLHAPGIFRNHVPGRTPMDSVDFTPKDIPALRRAVQFLRRMEPRMPAAHKKTHEGVLMPALWLDDQADKLSEQAPAPAVKEARRRIFNQLVAPAAGGPVFHDEAKAMLDAYEAAARAVHLPARRTYLDCEFLPWMTSTAGLVSIGLTDHEGHDYYAVNADMDHAEVQANAFQREHVWPQLPRTATLALDRDHPDVKPLEQIRAELTAYFDTGAETGLYAYYGASDLMRLHSLWRHDWLVMPTAIPRWLDDLKALLVRAGNPPMPHQESGEHHALKDARHNRAMHEALITLGRG